MVWLLKNKLNERRKITNLVETWSILLEFPTKYDHTEINNFCLTVIVVNLFTNFGPIFSIMIWNFNPLDNGHVFVGEH